jgi:hypothetical protein
VPAGDARLVHAHPHPTTKQQQEEAGTMTMEMFDTAGIPLAHRYEILFCGNCPGVHLIFFDVTDTPIAHATISADQARGILRAVTATDTDFREADQLQ